MYCENCKTTDENDIDYGPITINGDKAYQECSCNCGHNFDEVYVKGPIKIVIAYTDEGISTISKPDNTSIELRDYSETDGSDEIATLSDVDGEKYVEYFI